jgi:LmbE family N-acetylglucosaminyl deacetylase
MTTATTPLPDERPAALAIVAHPDDIEFHAAGTLLLLREAGWAIHSLNVADGDCGSMTMSREETSRNQAREPARRQASWTRSFTRASPPTC